MVYLINVNVEWIDALNENSLWLYIVSIAFCVIYFLQKLLFDRSIRERNSTVSFLNLAKLLLIENFV